MNAFLDSAGLWLRDITLLSWKGSLLALIVGVSILLLRRRLSPAWRHGLWLLVLVRLAVPDLGTSPLSLSRWMAVPRPAESPSTSITAPRLAVPLPPGTPPEPLSMIEAPMAPARPDEFVTGTPTRHPTPWTSWQWLTLGWLLGVGIVIGVMVVLHLRMRLRVRRDRTEPSSNALASLRQACALARVKRMPALIVTDAVRAPALFGIVRPAILLPRKLAASCDSASLNLVLLHELAHLQRRDLWAQVAAALAMALHWFNPVVWWTGRRLRAEAEMAADARALRYTDANDAHRMGELLLGFANGAAAGWIALFATATVLGISGNKRNMRRRIEALMDLARGRRTWWLMGLAAFVALAVTGLTSAPAEDSKKAEATTTTVTGIVIDETGKPIQGATCMLAGGPEKSRPRPRTIKSDGEGRFRFEGVPVAVDSRLSARHEDYLKSNPLFTRISGNPQEEHQIVLTKATGWLSGTVTRKADGTPIKDATVCIRDATDSGILMALDREKVKTDESGRYRVRNTVGTSGLMWIDAPGMAFTAKKFTWKEGELILDHALESDTRLTGKILSTEGKPIKDAVVCLSERPFLMDPSLPPYKMWKSENYMIGTGYWLGKPTTDEHGTFAGRSFDSPSHDKAWLIAYHPTEGVQRVRLRDWSAGATMKLDRWNTVHGTLTDRDGKAVSGATVEFLENEIERDANDDFSGSVMHRSSTTTDEQGHYKLDQILPRSRDSVIRVNETSVSPRGFPLGAGETKQFDIRLRAQPPAAATAPKKNLRKVNARIVVPPGRSPTSDEYEIGVTVEMEGKRRFERETPNGSGRISTKPIEPGNYLLHAWVNPTDRKLSPVGKGVSMRFKLERDDEHQTLDLGDITLDADNFEFHPISPKTAKAKTPQRPRQSLDAPVAQGGSFATWAGSSGSGAADEQAVAAGGRIVGETPVSSNMRFIIRGTKADGTRHFTAAQVANDDASETINGPLSFHPGVAVLGQIHGLPADYKGDGWIVAADEVYAETTPRTLVKGRIPMLKWHAWAPVERDGKFSFTALPRGGVFLMGFGNGWTTSSGYTGTMFHVNLTEAEPLTKVDIDTKPTLEQRVRLLLPDGSPAAGAKISVTSVSSTWWDRPLGHWGHDVDAHDRAAYERYKNSSIPGHNVVADAEGFATLRNQLNETSAKVVCEVQWTDPLTRASCLEKVNIQLRVDTEGPQEVKLTGKNE